MTSLQQCYWKRWMNQPSSVIHVIGGGLAGCEAAWQAAQSGVDVIIHEMRQPDRMTQAHKTDGLAELVCSNSFRSDDQTSGIGLLHAELRALDSLILHCGDKCKVPAGGALAVDREQFSQMVEAYITGHPNITVVREEITSLPSQEWEQVIIATGPLTSDALADAVGEHMDAAYLSFFDAIAPIVYKESIDMDKAWFQSRYDKAGPGGTGADYINCPLTKEQYYTLVEALVEGEKIAFKEWEKDTPYFEGCLPIEVMAERGKETLRYGPFKPVGLTNPHSEEKPYAVVQLRQDNRAGTLYNMVGFQTKLTYGEQKRIFQTIPGLEKADFARLGGIHRNTFIQSPLLLDEMFRLKSAPHIRFAGQITGVEGYIESASTGLITGLYAAAELTGKALPCFPAYTALGALQAYVTQGPAGYGVDKKAQFQPMNINWGIIEECDIIKTRNKKEKRAARAAHALESVMSFKQSYLEHVKKGGDIWELSSD